MQMLYLPNKDEEITLLDCLKFTLYQFICPLSEH